ncbi:MAG: hypothetical protein IJW02_03910 [Clostridia bacterium]|nr:hypothetical protein [Clostridia bacterium]
MARAYKIKKSANPSKESTGRSAGMTAPKKLMLLFTIVNRNKAEFYADVLQKFEINMQIILAANGTADTKIQSLLGLTDLQKSVIISVIRRDKSRAALSELDEKFRTVKGGKGIAYTVPMTSTIGVAIYQFLSNTTSGGLI